MTTTWLTGTNRLRVWGGKCAAHLAPTLAYLVRKGTLAELQCDGAAAANQQVEPAVSPGQREPFRHLDFVGYADAPKTLACGGEDATPHHRRPSRSEHVLVCVLLGGVVAYEEAVAD